MPDRPPLSAFDRHEVTKPLIFAEPVSGVLSHPLPEGGRINRACQLSGPLRGAARFLGQRPRLEALELLADADVFLQPSLFEGHSLALIEASKLGLPLIVSDAPSQVEGVTGPDGSACGIVVGVRDADAPAGEIQRLLDDPAHRQVWEARSWRLGEGVRFDGTVAAYEALVFGTGVLDKRL